MNIKELFGNIFNCVILPKDEYETLIKIQEDSKHTEEHNNYIKYWICVAGCEEVIVEIGYSYFKVKPETIADDKLIYTKTEPGGTITKDNCDLADVSIPEQYKSDYLGTAYDPNEKWQTTGHYAPSWTDKSFNKYI